MLDVRDTASQMMTIQCLCYICSFSVANVAQSGTLACLHSVPQTYMCSLSPVQCCTYLPTKGRDQDFLLSLWIWFASYELFITTESWKHLYKTTWTTHKIHVTTKLYRHDPPLAHPTVLLWPVVPGTFVHSPPTIQSLCPKRLAAFRLPSTMSGTSPYSKLQDHSLSGLLQLSLIFFHHRQTPTKLQSLSTSEQWRWLFQSWFHHDISGSAVQTTSAL